MKKRIYHIFSFVFIISSLILLNLSGGVFGQGLDLGNTSTILNTNIDEAINTSTNDGNGTIGDPIREGAYQIINANNPNNPEQQIGGIISNDIAITDHETALENTLSIIKNIINYALGLVSLVALVYLIAHGFMIVTAAGDEAKYKKGLAGIQYAAIALAGIGLSRFIVSFIFWIIQSITE